MDGAARSLAIFRVRRDTMQAAAQLRELLSQVEVSREILRETLAQASHALSRHHQPC